MGIAARIGGSSMLKYAIAITAVTITLATVEAQARDTRTLTGAAIGAGTGALVLGPVGAVVGGAVGAVVGGPPYRRSYNYARPAPRHHRHRR